MTWKYVGNGEFIPGIPTRDLTDAEAKEHLADVKASPLYQRVPRKARTAKSPQDRQEEE